MAGKRKPRLLDLFCGAGGCSVGYARAGFEVVGVDIEPQPRYPFEFIEADALKLMRATRFLRGFDAVHASPPCQAFVSFSWGKHPSLIEPVRGGLIRAGIPYVIENVVGAPLIDPVRYCGSSFGLDVRRHRLFESSVPLAAPACAHARQKPRFYQPDRRLSRKSSVVAVYGHSRFAGDFEIRKKAMNIDWMALDELNEAIPPDYTEHVGKQLIQHV